MLAVPLGFFLFVISEVSVHVHLVAADLKTPLTVSPTFSFVSRCDISRRHSSSFFSNTFKGQSLTFSIFIHHSNKENPGPDCKTLRVLHLSFVELQHLFSLDWPQWKLWTLRDKDFRASFHHVGVSPCTLPAFASFNTMRPPVGTYSNKHHSRKTAV